MNKIAVGISDYKTTTWPDSLVTYALGSCVGVTLYDPVLRIGGLSHIMLPNSSLKPGVTSDERMKFADTAIGDMLCKMESLGAVRDRIFAKIAGGASMFGSLDDTFIGTIGNRNIAAVRNELKRLGIPLVAEDVGENYGRTVHVNLEDGSVLVQTIGKGEREL